MKYIFLNQHGLETLVAQIKLYISNLLKNKVDKIDGKSLSENDYTTPEREKLRGISEGANKTIVDGNLDSSSANPVENKVISEALNLKADLTLKGSANGLAELDSTGHIPESQLPDFSSIIDEINKKLEMAEFGVDSNGNLTYTDNTAYTYTVNNDGMLAWEVE